MEKSKTIEKLKTLANGADGRSESARLADIIDHVENALNAGVKRQVVLDTLHHSYGFTMGMSGFEKALRKLRNKKDKTPHAEPVSQSNNVESTKKQQQSVKFTTPQERRNYGINALKNLDNDIDNPED